MVPGVSSQLIDRAFDVLAKKGCGEELELRDLPIVSRMVGDMPDEWLAPECVTDPAVRKAGTPG